jgi:HK97 family phage portal protein
MSFLDMIGWPKAPAEERSQANTPELWAKLIQGWDNSGTTASPEQALTATPVFAAVNFLSSALASLSVHVERKANGKWERIDTGIAPLLSGNINDEWDSYRWRKYSFWQTLTGGRQFTWIERPNGQVLNLWPLDPNKVTVARVGMQTVYRYAESGTVKEYPAADIIDLPFALAADQITHISPLAKGANAIGLLLAMEKYASGFFAGGGVPPLVMEGPLPQGPEAMKRAMADVNRAIDAARDTKKPIFAMPGGHSLKQVGFEPDKGQMTEARRFQVEEVARLYDLPPWFLQDLSHANFANSENQDLHLVKHTLAHWAMAWESQCNLKLFGRRNTSRRVRINMDSLLRGDFKTRADAVAALVQAGVYQPNDGRQYMGLERSDDPAAERLYMQGATVPLGTQLATAEGDGNDDGA